MEHTYHVVNTLVRPIKVLGVSNRKPCCGDVQPVTPVVLSPGQAVDVKVTLHAGTARGLLEHVASIETDDVAFPATVIHTRALLQPKVLIEAVDLGSRSLLSGESAKFKFVMRSYGTDRQPALDLNDCSVAGEVPVDWSEVQKTVSDEAAGVVSNRREFTAVVQADGAPGDKTAELHVLHGRETVARTRVNWETAPTIKASPSAVVFAREAPDAPRTVLLHAQDRRAFRVLSVTSASGRTLASAKLDRSSENHPVEIRRGAPGDRTDLADDVVITTDHPRQAVVKISVFSVD